jgi:cell division protein FtsN
MQKHIIPVLASFFSVIVIILLGMNIAYRTNVIPQIEADHNKKREELHQQVMEKETYISTLENELNIARERQIEAEKDLAEKLAEEERIALEKAQKEQEARIAAEQAAAAEAARIAAEQAKSSSKESKAS